MGEARQDDRIEALEAEVRELRRVIDEKFLVDSLSITTAATRLSCSRRTLGRMIERGLIRTFTVMGVPRIRVTELTRYIQESEKERACSLQRGGAFGAPRQSATPGA